MRRAPQKAIPSTWKWNASTGTPLGDVAAPVVPGQPRSLAGWPDFRGLLVALDQGCSGRYGRLWEQCPRCLHFSLPSYFSIYQLTWDRALKWGTMSPSPAWSCRLWGQSCPAKIRGPIRPETSAADTPSTAHSSPDSRQASRPGPSVLFEETAPVSPSFSGRSSTPARPSYSDIEAELRQTKELLAAAVKKQDSAPPPMVGPLSAGLMLPHVPRLKSLESQGTIKAWIAHIEQFCSQWAVPEEARLRWALAGLEDEAAKAWGGLVYLRDDTVTTVNEIGEMLLRYNRKKHSMYSLWGLWAALRQGPGESAQTYCDRVRDLQAQEKLHDRWAVAAMIRGIREPLRTRFYDTLQG